MSQSNEPKDQSGAQYQAQIDRSNGVKTDTQNWSYVQRQNYENAYNTPKK